MNNEYWFEDIAPDCECCGENSKGFYHTDIVEDHGGEGVCEIVETQWFCKNCAAWE